MSHQDQLFRFLFEELDIRGELVYLESTWTSVLERASYPKNVQRQLGQALSAVAILAATIKFDGSLILQIQGNGPLKTLVAQASNQGKLRGLAKWDEEVPSGNLHETYGQGRIVITIRNTHGDDYQSIVSLDGDNLGSALEKYFADSEQLKSRFWLFVAGNQVAGLFLQELPTQTRKEQGTTLGTTLNTMSESNWDRISILTDTITPKEMFTLKPQELLHRLYHEEKVSLFEPTNTAFECSCSSSKIESSLLAMGEAALMEILNEEGAIKVDCEFCLQHYHFATDDINQILLTASAPMNDKVIH